MPAEARPATRDGKTASSDGGSLDPVEKAGSEGIAFWIDAEFEIKKSKKFGFLLTEKSGSPDKIVVGYDPVRQELFADLSGT